MITYEDFSKVEIRIGQIQQAEKIEKSEKLFLLHVDFGEEELRTVVSGIAPYFETPEELVDVQCAFVTNLEPRSLMGHESQAMILGSRLPAVAGSDGQFALVQPSIRVTPGSVLG